MPLHTSPSRTFFQFAVALWVSWKQALFAFKTSCFGGLICQVQVLKVGVPDAGFKFPLLREKPGVMSALPIVTCHARGGVHCGIVCQLLLPTSVWFFSPFICLACKSSSVIEFLSEEMCSLYSCSFGVPMGGSPFRILQCHRFAPELPPVKVLAIIMALQFSLPT